MKFFGFLLNFLYGASWAFLLLGALVTYQLTSYLGLIPLIISEFLFVFLSLFIILILEYLFIKANYYKQVRKNEHTS